MNLNNLKRFMASLALLICSNIPGISWADSDFSHCFNTPCVDTRKVNMKIQTLRKGVYKYPVPEGNDDYYSFCGKFCTCEEDIRYVEFSGEGENIKSINNELKKAASIEQCSIDSATIRVSPLVVYARPGLISVVYHVLNYGTGANGSCHGGQESFAFDTKTGKRLFLKDIARLTDDDALKNDLLKSFMEQKSYFGDLAEENIELMKKYQLSRKEAVRELLKNMILNQTPIFIDKGKAYIDLNDFVGGCAGGSFYPIEIPAQDIKPDFFDIRGHTT